MFIPEVIVAIVVLVLMILVSTMEQLLMPMNLNTVLITSFIASFLVFLALFWREDNKDERDKIHNLQAGKISFTFGASIIFIGIIFQSIYGNIDPWLIGALAVMILAKVISRIYSSLKQ